MIVNHLLRRTCRLLQELLYDNTWVTCSSSILIAFTKYEKERRLAKE